MPTIRQASSPELNIAAMYRSLVSFQSSVLCLPLAVDLRAGPDFSKFGGRLWLEE